MRLLAGDVGGTHTRLAVFEAARGSLRKLEQVVVRSEPGCALADLARPFVESAGPCVAACFGVPGPVEGGRVRTTNLPWRLDESALAHDLGIGAVRLVNDLVAHARALDELSPGMLVTLHPGRPDPEGPRVIVAPGTGLGVALAFHEGGAYRPRASEAGHLGFAPLEPEEFDLARALVARHGRASWERVVSGPGLAAIDALLAGRIERGPLRAPETVTAQAVAGGEARATRALGLFVRALARFAGDLALAARARGGVFLTGGIPPKILPRLREPDVVEAFVAKGRLADLARACPLQVVLDEDAGLLGAARLAAEVAG